MIGYALWAATRSRSRDRGPARGLPQPRTRWADDADVAAIETLVGCSAAALTGSRLCLGGEPLASLGDVTALVARAGPTVSLAEVVAALIAGRPSGIVVLGSADAASRLALALRDGRIASAFGPEPLQRMDAWVEEFRRRAAMLRGRGAATVAAEIDPARTYVAEAVLQALHACAEPGATLLLLQGEHDWLHDALPMDVAPDFGFVLMEHARRVDELPRIEAALRDLGQAVVPVRAPGEHPSGRVKVVSDSESDWDFFDDPDPAAEAEWLDARWVFDFCDGVTSIEGLGDATMLGRFRTLAAVLALLERDHVALSGHAGQLDELEDLILELAS